MDRSRAVIGMLVLPLTMGCIAPPGRDTSWASAPDRILYAQSQKRKATVSGAVGMGVMGQGAILALLSAAVISSINSDPILTDEDKRSFRQPWEVAAVIGVVEAVIGLAWGASQLSVRSQWADVIREDRSRFRGTVCWTEPTAGAPAAAGGAAREEEAGPAPWARLYVTSGSPIPAGLRGVDVVRISSPSDPGVAGIAARAGVLRWPVLECLDGPAGPGGLSLGPSAVAATLRAREGARGHSGLAGPVMEGEPVCRRGESPRTETR